MASRWLQYAADFAIAGCLGHVVHFALDNGHVPIVGRFVEREARVITLSLRQDLQVLLLQRRAGWLTRLTER